MTTHKLQGSDDHEDSRLDVFLTQYLPEKYSRTFIKKLIDHGHVIISDQPAKPKHKVVSGEIINVTVPDEFLKPTEIKPEDIPLDILYEDGDIIVINKPKGLLVHPATGIYTGTLVNALLHHCDELSTYQDDIMRPGIVHRLDQETSGVIIAAKNNKAHLHTAKQFQKHKVKKEYVALVEGQVEFDEGEIDVPIGRHPNHRELKKVSFDASAKEAFTQYKVLKRNKKASMVALFPKTGRTHQLRVHMKHLRHPILGDDKYGKRNTFARLALHAKEIQFEHPITKKKMTCCAPIPNEFEQFFQ